MKLEKVTLLFFLSICLAKIVSTDEIKEAPADHKNVSVAVINKTNINHLIRSLHKELEKQFIQLEQVFRGDKAESLLQNIFNRTSRELSKALELSVLDFEVSISSDINDDRYKFYKENCLVFKPINVSDTCYYNLRGLILNILRLVSDAQPEEQLKIINNTLDDCILRLRENNFARIADDKVYQLEAEIKHETKKIADAKHKLFSLTIWTDNTAVAEATKKKHELEDKIKILKQVSNNLTSVENLIQGVKENLKQFKDTAQTFSSMKQTLESKLKWVDNTYSKLSEKPNMAKDLQEQIYNEPKNWINQIYEMTSAIFKIADPIH